MAAKKFILVVEMEIEESELNNVSEYNYLALKPVKEWNWNDWLDAMELGAVDGRVLCCERSCDCEFK